MKSSGYTNARPLKHRHVTYPDSNLLTLAQNHQWPKGWVQGSKSGQMHWTWPWPRISSSDKSSKYFLPPTKRLFLVSPPREEWPFTPFSLSRHSLILLHLVSRRGHMSSPDRETRVLGNKQKTGMFSTFCLHLLFIWGVLGLTHLTRFNSRGIICGSTQQALPSVHHQLSLPHLTTRFPGFLLFIKKGRDCPLIIGHGQPWQTKNRPGPFLGPIYLNPVDGVRYASGVTMKVSYESLDERDPMVNKNSKCHPGKV